jgi:hypothetical protein
MASVIIIQSLYKVPCKHRVIECGKKSNYLASPQQLPVPSEVLVKYLNVASHCSLVAYESIRIGSLKKGAYSVPDIFNTNINIQLAITSPGGILATR